MSRPAAPRPLAPPAKTIGENPAFAQAPNYLIGRLSGLMNRAYSREYQRKIGVTASTLRLLALIDRAGPLHFRDIADRDGIDKGQLSRTLRTLYADGLLALVQNGKTRSRRQAFALGPATQVALTLKGRDIVRRSRPIARAHQARFAALLSAGEHDSLIRILRKLLDNIDALVED
jgi:DNA-binding MarR family transcriptional regulator